MSKSNPAVNPVPGYSEHIPDLKDDLDVRAARLEAIAETDRLPLSTVRDEPVVTRKELWAYYLYYNGDVRISCFRVYRASFGAHAISIPPGRRKPSRRYLGNRALYF